MAVKRKDTKEFLDLDAKIKQEIGSLVDAMLDEKREKISPKMKEWYAKFASQFADLYQYSVRNVMLIKAQCPIASFCTTYKGWQNFKNEKGEAANVQPFQKGLTILRPVIMKVKLDEDEQYTNSKGELVTEEEKIVAYQPAKTFDISQTNAIEIGAVKKFEKPLQHYGTEEQERVAEKVFDYLKTTIEKKYNIPVKFDENLTPTVNGYANGKEIVLNTDLKGNIDKLSTLTHEIGHSLMHFDEKGGKISSDLKEMQAETFAFFLKNRLGIEDNTKSISYIHSYLQNFISDKVSESTQLLRLKSEDPHLYRNKIAEIFTKAIGSIVKPFSDFMKESKLDYFLNERLEKVIELENRQNNEIKQNQTNDENLSQGVKI